jgi:hypothetical protein
MVSDTYDVLILRVKKIIGCREPRHLKCGTYQPNLSLTYLGWSCYINGVHIVEP